MSKPEPRDQQAWAAVALILWPFIKGLRQFFGGLWTWQ